MHTGLLKRQEEKALREQLQKRHKELVTLISTKYVENGVEYFPDERLVKAIQDQQNAWSQFKDSECELIGTLSAGIYSPWQSTYAVQCEVNLTRQRLKRTKHAIRCVKKIPPENRWFAQNTCLYQLAPLAVPLEK
jgi:uncharacterized protein YecT (DUF1311 family)